MKLADLAYYSYRSIKYQCGSKSPLIASIKLTYECNMSCIHCPWTDLPHESVVRADRWGKVLNELKKRGVRIVFLEGGETTLHPDLSKIIDLAKDIGLRVGVNTNGSNDLASYSPDCFIVSVDGDKKTHDLIRGNGSYDRMMANCSTTRVRKIGLMTISRANMNQVEEFITNNIEDSYFDALGFTIAYPVGKVIDNDIDMSKEEIDLVYSHIEKHKDRLDIINSKPSITTKEWKCRPWFVDVATPDGKIAPDGECLVTVSGEEKDCSKCNAGCYKEAMQILNGNLEAWYLWNKYFFT